MPKIGPKAAKQVKQQIWTDSKVVQSNKSPIGSPIVKWYMNGLIEGSLNVEHVLGLISMSFEYGALVFQGWIKYGLLVFL